MRNALLAVFFIVWCVPCSAQPGLPFSGLGAGDQSEISSRLDQCHPDVIRTAATIASDYPGEFSSKRY